MELFKKKYNDYMKLQSDFNQTESLEEQKKILKNLGGNSLQDENSATVVATFNNNYVKSDTLTRIAIVPKYIKNGDDIIPFELYNRYSTKSKPEKRIYASAKNIDNKQWDLIKELGNSKIFECKIYLHDKNDRDYFGKRHGQIFSFYPKTIKKIEIADLAKYEEKNPLMEKCSVYKIFKEGQSDELSEWTYDSFLILLQNDICDDIIEKARGEADKEKKPLIDEIKSLEKKRDDLRDKDIPDQESIKNKLDEDIRKKQTTNENLEKELKRISELIERRNNILKPFLLDANIDSIPPESPNRDVNEQNIASSHIDDDSVIISIQEKLKSDAELEYSKAVIEQMCTGLHTNQLIVLVGDPGSGKTSLASNFGKCLPLEGETKIIPVQPGWMDKSDLLGYYNPIEKSYVPTDFLDTLIDFCSDAKKNPGKYYFICLDEMNLSQIEYYFADFLSKLQTDRTISLYSSTIYEDIRSDYLRQAERFVKMHKGAIDDIEAYTTREEFEEYLKLEHTKKSLKRYKSEIIIPENVKFIGTLNQDETTKDISPKVLDRSIVIKLQNNVQKCILEKENVPEDNTVTEVTSRKEHWEAIIRDLQKYNLTVSKRLDNVFKDLNPLFKDNDRFFDTVISTMILPKINCSPYQTDIKGLKTILDTYCTPNRVSSYNIFLDMKNRCENEQQDLLTFWSK